jgi:hypothetical protein
MHSRWTFWAVAIVVGVAGCCASCAVAGIIVYVDDDAPAGGDGTTWPTAFRFLQDGLAFAANPANGVTEVRVAQGTYIPDRNEENPNGTGDRWQSFELIDDVALRGGYRGLDGGGPDPEARDHSLFETVLSGDLAGDDHSRVISERFVENSLHVVNGEGAAPSAILDGFTITGGYAYAFAASPEGLKVFFGGGCMAYDGQPTIARCRFEANFAGQFGGGLLICSNEDLALADCAFRGNETGFQGGGASITGSSVTVSRCTFDDNAAFPDGGGLLIGSDQSASISNCRFHRSFGGAIFVFGGFASVNQCVITQGIGSASAIMSQDNEPVDVRNCTILSDAAPFSGQDFIIRNSVIQAEEPVVGVFMEIWHSLVPRKFVGAMDGVIHGDPLFVDADGTDNILGTEDDDLRLRPGSPCIDAADNTAVPAGVEADLAGRPRFVDDPDTPDTGNSDGIHAIVDMGAYEFNPACMADTAPVPGGNGVINIDDLLFIINHWGATGNHTADVTFNGFVNIADLLAVINAWGPCN